MLLSDAAAVCCKISYDVVSFWPDGLVGQSMVKGEFFQLDSRCGMHSPPNVPIVSDLPQANASSAASQNSENVEAMQVLKERRKKGKNE